MVAEFTTAEDVADAPGIDQGLGGCLAPTSEEMTPPVRVWLSKIKREMMGERPHCSNGGFVSPSLVREAFLVGLPEVIFLDPTARFPSAGRFPGLAAGLLGLTKHINPHFNT